MRTLRVGVLGLGAFGESHIRAYRGLPHVEIVAVASRRPEHAREIADRYGIQKWYGSYQEIIDDASINAVSITTAEHEHRASTVAALAAGKHVLVEKPLASTLEDARAIVEAARDARGILMPGHILRFEPKYAMVREAVVAGRLGRLVSVRAQRNRPQGLIKTHSRVHPALITAIHDIDIMLWVIGSRVRRVQAIDRIASKDDGAHGLWGLMEFADGTIGTIETSWMLRDESGVFNDDAFEVSGTGGTAKIQLDSPALRFLGEHGLDIPDVSYEPVVHGVLTGALRDELSHFASSALAGTPSPIITPEEAYDTLEVVLALIEAASSGQAVVL